MKFLIPILCVLVLTLGCSVSREDKSKKETTQARMSVDSQNAGDSDVDLCGVENGDGTTCADCKGVPNGGASFDICDVCDGDGTSCLDCKGIAFGDATFDACGVCDGDGNCTKAYIINRQVFHNRSTGMVFKDGSGNPKKAIDPLKIALLPNQTAGTLNYTNYNRGINGIVVDIEGTTGSFSSNDLELKTWNGIDIVGFTQLSSPATVTEIAMGGINYSKRIKIEFQDGAVKNTWLRVKVIANKVNNLKSDDVFYFGNAIADVYVGNIATPLGSPITVRVNATDTSTVRQNQSPGINSVGISNFYDINKDGRVNATDTSTVRQNQNPSLIQMFKAPNEVLTGNNNVDECGVVNGNNSNCADCFGVAHGLAVKDECDVCDGDSASCKDCLGVPNGDAELDDCGICNGGGVSCSTEPTFTITGIRVIAKNGMPTGMSGEVGETLEISGVGLETSSMKVQFVNSAPVPFSYNAILKILSGTIPTLPPGNTSVTVNGGANSVSVTFSTALRVGRNPSTIDACGVVDGDGTSCADCLGEPNGLAYLDDYQTCCPTRIQIDCFGRCDGGEELDCNSDCGGTASFDRCGDCDGDGSSCPAMAFTITGLNVIAKNGTPTGLEGEVGDTLQISAANLETSSMMVQFWQNTPVPFSYDVNSKILSGLIPAGLAGITSVTVIGANNGANVIASQKLKIGVTDCLNGQFDECDVCDGNGTTCTLTPLDDDIILQLSNIRPSVPWTADSPIFDPDGIPPLNKADALFVMPIDPPDDLDAFDQAIYQETGSYDQGFDVSFADPSKGIPACFFSTNGLKDSFGSLYTATSIPANKPGAQNLTWPIVNGALEVPYYNPYIQPADDKGLIAVLKHPNSNVITGWSAVENNEYAVAVDYHFNPVQRHYWDIQISEQLDEGHPLAPATSTGTSFPVFGISGDSGIYNRVFLFFGANAYTAERDGRWMDVGSPSPVSVPLSGQVKVIWKFTGGLLKVRVLINNVPVYLISIDAIPPSTFMSETQSILTTRSWPPYKSWRVIVGGFSYNISAPSTRYPIYIERFQASARYLGPTPTPSQ